jgi:hypothetical protein
MAECTIKADPVDRQGRIVLVTINGQSFVVNASLPRTRRT